MTYTLDTVIPWQDTYAELAWEFERWGKMRGGVASWSVGNTTNGRHREREVTLSYQLPGDPPVRLVMAKQANAQSNLRVLFLAVQAIRKNEARGIGDLVRAAYLALPPPTVRRDPFEVLGVRPDAPKEIIEVAYRTLAKTAHPDTGGSAEKMAELNAAYEAAKGK